MPWVVIFAAVAALVTVVLHLLSVRRPPPMSMPTARFVPPSDARMVVRGRTPVDRLLLALRVASLAAIGAAFAGVRCDAIAPRHARIVVASAEQRADSAMWWPAELNTDNGEIIPLWVSRLNKDPGVAIVAARREAARVFSNVPAMKTVALTVVMPARVQSLRGWDAWKNDWPGVVQVLTSPADSMSNVNRGIAESEAQRVAGRAANSLKVSGRSEYSATVFTQLKDDPVVAAVAGFAAQYTSALSKLPSSDGQQIDGGVRYLNGEYRSSTSTVLVIRDSSEGSHGSLDKKSASDSKVDGKVDSNTVAPVEPQIDRHADTVLVYWPENGAPAGWAASEVDTVGAVVANGMALIAPFVRSYKWEDTGAIDHDADTSIPIVRWSDGTVAAIERATPRGCDRFVYLPLNGSGDLLLSARASGVLSALLLPCGFETISTNRVITGSITSADSARMAVQRNDLDLQGRQTRSLSAWHINTEKPQWLMPALLTFALLLLIAEQWIRRRVGRVGGDRP